MLLIQVVHIRWRSLVHVATQVIERDSRPLPDSKPDDSRMAGHAHGEVIRSSHGDDNAVLMLHLSGSARLQRVQSLHGAERDYTYQGNHQEPGGEPRKSSGKVHPTTPRRPPADLAW